MSRRTVLIYGQIDLNLLDGSASWLVSTTAMMARTGSDVHLLLQAPIETERLVGRLRDLPNLTLHESPAPLSMGAAQRRLEDLALALKADVLVARGRMLTDIFSESPVLAPILWAYVTDFGFPLTELTAFHRDQLRRIVRRSRRFFVQTEESRDYVESVIPETAGRTLLMPPTVPDDLFTEVAPRPEGETLRLIYAGKFHRDWRTLEMLQLPRLLGEAGIPATLTMLGDKFMVTDERWGTAMRRGLEDTPGVTWGGGVSREEVIAQLAQHDIGLSWRTRELDSSLELSTKLLEYAATGTPPVLNRTRAHEALLGSDYPLFLDDDSPETIVRVLSQRGDLDQLRQRVQDAARAHSGTAAVARYERYFQREEELSRSPLDRVRETRVAVCSATPHLLARELSAGSGLEVENLPFPVTQPLEATPDVIVAEGEAAVWWSRNRPPGSRLVVRLTSSTPVPWPGEIGQVERFVLPPGVSDEGLPAERISRVPVTVDAWDAARPKTADARFRLALLELRPGRDDLQQVLRFMEELVARDERHHLHIAAELPWESDGGADAAVAESAQEFFRALAESPARSHISFLRPGPHLGGWLRTVGWVLLPGAADDATSLEAVASGAVPVRWSREPGWDAFCHDDPAAAAAHVARVAADSDAVDQAREEALQQGRGLDVVSSRSAWAEVLERVAPGERHFPSLNRTPGSRTVSVVLPCYKSKEWMVRCIGTLAAQTLPREFFEAVLVFNGPDDGGEELARDLLTAAGINFQILHSEPGAPTARNEGTRHAVGEWQTFLDVDDTISPTYLEYLRDSAVNPLVVPLATMMDIREGEEPQPSAAAHQIMPRPAGVVNPSDVWRAMSITVLKLLPAKVAQAHLFDETLRSGEDVALFFGMFDAEGLSFDTTPAHRGAVYHRLIRQGSVSRQVESYDFMVSQRLAVMEALEKPFQDGLPRLANAIDVMILSQSEMVREYVRRHPEERERVLADVEERGLRRFPMHMLPEATTSLAIAYASVPFNDPSAITTMKRLIQRGGQHNIISADMTTARSQDRSLLALARGVIAEQRQVPGAVEWFEWEPFERFCELGWEALLDIERSQPRQETVYSRALWAPAHFLAALIKARRPETVWTAEFSDPLHMDVLGEPRTGYVEPGALTQELGTHLAGLGFPVPDGASFFQWAEYLPYAMADRLVFTNDNQLAYMMNYLGNPTLRARVEERAVIEPHPTLPPRYYALGNLTQRRDRDHLHLAYFGSFYANRGLGDVLGGLAKLPPEKATRVRIHVFSSDQEELRDGLAGHPYRAQVTGYKPLPYLSFLASCATFDVLLANDAHTGTANNPYLPSKIADYKGSGVPIWAVVEPGSALSRDDVAHKTKLGDHDAAAELLARLVEEKLATGR